MKRMWARQAARAMSGPADTRSRGEDFDPVGDGVTEMSKSTPTPRWSSTALGQAPSSPSLRQDEGHPLPVQPDSPEAPFQNLSFASQ